MAIGSEDFAGELSRTAQARRGGFFCSFSSSFLSRKEAKALDKPRLMLSKFRSLVG